MFPHQEREEGVDPREAPRSHFRCLVAQDPKSRDYERWKECPS
jgi:hypothetical protein